MAFQLEEFSRTPVSARGNPSPEDAAVMVEELERVMNSLDSTQRQILELKLQNLSEEEICKEVQRSGRTVKDLAADT